MTPLEKFEIINRTMEEDFKKGFLPDYLKPYFEWRLSNDSRPAFTLQEAEEMYDKASSTLDDLYDRYPHAYANIHDECNDNPWQITEGFVEDKRMVAYLEIVTDHITDMKLADMWR